MPTLKEFEARLDAAGITDKVERRRRISEAYQNKELEAEPLVQYKPFSEMPGPAPEPEVGGLAGVIHDIYTRPQRTGEFIESVKTSEPFTRSARKGEFLQEVVTGKKAPRRVAEEQALTAEEPTEPLAAVSPEEIISGGMPAAGAPGPGVKLPKLEMPEIENLRTKLGELGEAWKGAQKGLKGAFKKQRGAIGEMAEAQKEAIRAEADILQEQERVSQDLETQRVQKEERRQTYINQEMGKLRDSVDEMQAMKIDPYRFYKHPDGSANFPKSIAAAVAVGLGALGASLPAQYGGTGGPNVALQIIDKAIDRDIAAQRDDIANRRAGVGMQMNLLSQMRAKFADERQAENAARVIMLEHYKTKLQAAKSRAGDKYVQARADMLIAETDIKQAQIIGDMEVKAGAQAFEGEKTLYTAGMQQAQAVFNQEMSRLKSIMGKSGKQLPANAVAKMADFRGAAKMVQHVKRAWNENMKGNWAAGLTQYAPWATDAKSFDDMIRMAAQIIGKKFEGRMTDEDYARFLEMMPKAGDSTRRAMNKMNTMASFLDALESETIRTYQEVGFNVSGFRTARQDPTAGFKEL